MAERHQQSELLRQRAFTVLAREISNIISKNHPSDLLGEKAMKEEIGGALEFFSGVKISLAIVFHLECAELAKFQEFLKMVLRSKAQQESIIR